MPAPFRPAAALLMACAWPLQAALEARREARRIDPAAFPGKGRGSLVRAAWRAALRHNVPPLEFFAYRMPDSPGTPPDAWLFQAEIARLLAALGRPEAQRLAADKLAFAAFCEAQGLPSVPTLASIAPGIGAPEPSAPAIVIKPRRGANGRAVTLWARSDDGWRLAGRGAPTGWAQVQAAALAACADEMLAQPLLRPHPALAAHCGAGCGVARIVTGLWPDGRCEPVCASFAVPPPQGITSNGGPRRMVELSSGRLLQPGPGRLRDVFGAPGDGAALDGLTLPDWPAALELALAGHRAFPPRAVLLGWDVAFTPDGPVLIEANMSLSFFLEQYESLVPAGGQRGAELIAAWLA